MIVALTGGHIGTHRHEVRKRLLEDLEAAKRWRNLQPWSRAAQVALEQAWAALRQHDQKWACDSGYGSGEGAA